MWTTTQASIQVVTAQITYYSPIVLLIIGIIGCLCNLLTFTAPQLRNNPCSFYFLISAVFELLSITFGLISRFAADHLSSTLINTDRVYCKLRAYLVSALPLVATYLILLSSVDRCMSTSVSARLRSFSQIKVAYRTTIVAIVVGFVSCVHILVGYDLRPRCGALGGVFSMYDGMFVVFWLGILPHVLMLVFGFVTIINIRRTKRRIAIKPTVNGTASQRQQRRAEKTDAQLIIVSSKSFRWKKRVLCHENHLNKSEISFVDEKKMEMETLLFRWCLFKLASALYWSWHVWSIMLTFYWRHHWLATIDWSVHSWHRSPFNFIMVTMSNRFMFTPYQVNCFVQYFSIEWNSFYEKYSDHTQALSWKILPSVALKMLLTHWLNNRVEINNVPNSWNNQDKTHSCLCCQRNQLSFVCDQQIKFVSLSRIFKTEYNWNCVDQEETRINCILYKK